MDLTDNNMKAIFNNIDVDDNGTIDYTEFLACCLGTSLSWGKKYLK